MNNQQNELHLSFSEVVYLIRKEFAQDELGYDEAAAILNEAIHPLITQQLTAQLDRLEKWVEYNKHDMGEMGEFIRTKYVHNAITQEREQL